MENTTSTVPTMKVIGNAHGSVVAELHGYDCMGNQVCKCILIDLDEQNCVCAIQNGESAGAYTATSAGWIK